MYPSAKGIAWSQDEEYYVADFMMNGFDTKVWFNTDAEWVMKQTDWETLDEVPAAVFNAFAASQFSDGVVQNVVWVQFPKWQPIVAIQVGRPNVQIKYQILFTRTVKFSASRISLTLTIRLGQVLSCNQT